MINIPSKEIAFKVLNFLLHYILELRFHNEPNLDIATKRRICRDIFESNLFSEYEEEVCVADSWISRLLGLDRKFYSFRIIEVSPIYSSQEPVQEYAFLCLTRKGFTRSRHYISEEYNLSINSEAPEDYIAGRFIFFHPFDGDASDAIYLFGLAEVPAKVLFTLDHNIERVYLERKQDYETGKS